MNISNYPNPFSSQTTISFNLITNSTITLEIYNTKGQKVKTLLSNEMMRSDLHQSKWNGKNKNNELVENGVYFYKLQTGEDDIFKKLLLIR